MSIWSAIPISRFTAGLKNWRIQCADTNCSRALTSFGINNRSGIFVDGEWYCESGCFQRAVERRVSEFFRPRAKVVPRSPRLPLELVLLSRGRISESQLKQAFEYAEAAGTDVVGALKNLGLVNEELLTSARAVQWGYPVYPLTDQHSIDLSLVPLALIETYGCLPVHVSHASKKLLLAFVQGIDYSAIHAIEKVCGLTVAPCFVGASAFRRCLHNSRNLSFRNEVIFGSIPSLEELAGIVGSYARQIGAQEAHCAVCEDFVWIRLKRGEAHFDLLFQRNTPGRSEEISTIS